MIKTKVIKRYIQTLPIQDMIIRTDNLAESIQFELVNWIEDIDYGAEGWQWFIYYKTTIDSPVVTPITYTVSEDRNHVYLLWDVDHNITKRSGNLDFQIRGKLDTEKGLIEWNSSVATINLGHALDPDDHDTDENILEWYLDRMEQLAQSGIADILSERERAMAVEAELRADLDAEIERSITKDNDLQQQIDEMEGLSTEITDALRRDLTAEINRSTREDIRLNTALNAEISRATEAENQLQDNLDAEIERATEAENLLKEDLTAETERAKQEERNLRGALESNVLDLTNKIEAETERATNREQELEDAINQGSSELNAKIDAEIERATNEETAIRNEMAENVSDLNSSIQAETERATQAEQQLQNNLDAETQRATEAEQQLQSNLDTAKKELEDSIQAETDRATEAEETLRTDLTEAINIEQERAETAEKALDDRITAETERATNAENTLRTDLTSLINQETQRATEAETTLQSNIDAEEERATNREDEIEAKLDAEIQRSTTADNKHDADIAQTNSDLADAKEELQANIDAEEQRATNAEALLQSNIEAETNRATTAENALGNRITEVEGSLTSSITILQRDLQTEVQTRTTETTRLTQDLNTTNTNLTNTTNSLNSEIERSTAEDEKLTDEVTSLSILEGSAPAGIAHRYYLSLTRGGSATTRGVYIDIPVSDAISAGYFDEENNELVFTLSNGNEVRIPFNDLIQYYGAGDGLQLTEVDHENNQFSIKFDTASGTQGILSATVNGLAINLSNYYTKPESNNLLNEKQDNLIEDTSQSTRYYPPVRVDAESNIITLKPEILADLGIAYQYSGDARAWVINLAGTTINGIPIGQQTDTDILGKTIRLYEPLEGNTPPTVGNVLIAGENGTYKDSTFTIQKSVPADAKFTDTLYYPTTEDNPEGLFTRTEQVKLENIQAGAEVNVQPDWNQTDDTQDDFIKNKPVNATQTTDGFMSHEDKTKLDDIQAGAEVNQNAFSNVTVGESTVSASSKTDTFTLVGEGSTTVTADLETKTITIKSEDVAQADWEETDIESPAYIKNKPGLATSTEDGFMSASDKDKLDKVEDTYLPLAGGTMTGPINSQNLVPTANATYSQGSDTNRYQNVYASNGYFLGSPADGKGIFFNATTGGFDFIC